MTFRHPEDPEVTALKERYAKLRQKVPLPQTVGVATFEALLKREAKRMLSEVEKPNKAFIDAVRKGVVLFGQEKFINFIKGVTKK